MEDGIIKCLSKYVNYLDDVYSMQRARADELQDYKGIVLRKMKNNYDSIFYKSRIRGTKKDKYFGTEGSENVELVKEAHYYKYSIPRIESNLKICRKVLQRLEKTDYDSIDEVLPKTYRGAKLKAPSVSQGNAVAEMWKKRAEAYKESRGPWFPEDLTTTTADDSLVRSKSEGLIYNHYLSQGCTFVYELPYEVDLGIWRHPDFSILSEIDWKTVILHDHQGRYGFEEDRKRYERDMYMYWRRGFIPGVNIFYTFDDPRGGFNISTVQNIIDTRIRPK